MRLYFLKENTSGKRRAIRMSVDQLAKDPARAAEILATLEEKDTEATACRYPTCQEPRQTAPATGRPVVYCQNPEHNPVTNHRARQYLKALTEGMTSETAVATRESSKPPGMAPVESLRNSVLGRITQLQSEMERYLAALTTIADPDLSAAQIRAALDQADARVAAAQQDVSVERSLRLTAETARMAGEAEARAEREAAEQAIGRMEEAEAKTRRRIEEIEQQKEEAERRIAELQAEHADAINRLHVETERRIEEREQQAKDAIAQAQAATATAQEETRQANAHTHEARVQAATASGLVIEARATLDRERAEVDRLRGELAATIKDARTRAEADRADARIALDRERAEIERLRAELTTTRTRADQLATQADGLRAQLKQVTERESPQ